MVAPAHILDAATADGFLLVLSIFVPIACVLLAFVTGGRKVERIALAALPAGLAIAVAIAAAKAGTATPIVYLVGGWAPPLGVALRADGLSAVMMLIAALVICAVGIYARADFRTPPALGEARAPFSFWILLLSIWSALNLVFVAGDLFTLYVGLELLTFAAVPLVCLDGRPETFRAALRYLLFALLGSVLYLAGTVLIYGAYGTLDIALLSQRIRPEPSTIIAAALMTAGLLAKTALFPLHLWLPPAHASAPAAASAVLSALVVKGPFFIAVRLWFDVMPNLPAPAGRQMLAGLGAAAIVFGSILALRQARLKLLIAYSTLAQIGYLFLMFGLDSGAGAALRSSALSGGMMQAMSHATAKAAMFMAAGLIYAGLGHDKIAGLAGAGRAMPITMLAFAVGGLALMGVPLSGAYLAKDLLLGASDETGQWWWAAVIQAGGIFTSAYLFLVLANALMAARKPIKLRPDTPRSQEAVALALALCSLFLGLLPWGEFLPLPGGRATPNPFTLKALSTVAGTFLAGSVLAIFLARWEYALERLPPLGSFFKWASAVRRVALGLAKTFERVDSITAHWPAGGISLLTLAVLFGVALWAG
jgi:formate hydrogenlyase subunit 3/multisubunit Na+/H+ antiporter MnhD subunit